MRINKVLLVEDHAKYAELSFNSSAQHIDVSQIKVFYENRLPDDKIQIRIDPDEPIVKEIDISRLEFLSSMFLRQPDSS